MAKGLLNGADYYRARAAEMLEKAQSAESKAIRYAYLNLARIWARHAENLERAAPKDPPPDPSQN